MVTTAAQKK